LRIRKTGSNWQNDQAEASQKVNMSQTDVHAANDKKKAIRTIRRDEKVKTEKVGEKVQEEKKTTRIQNGKGCDSKTRGPGWCKKKLNPKKRGLDTS